MKEQQEQALKNLHRLGEEMRKSMEEYKKYNDKWWNNLSEKEREDAFFAVTSRIFQAEVEDRRSYRGSMYGVFGFEPSMYAMGMESGYFAIHNMLFDAHELEAMKQVKRFEVIDENGRSYTKYLKEQDGIVFSLQDDNQTLKVFIDENTWEEQL